MQRYAYAYGPHYANPRYAYCHNAVAVNFVCSCHRGDSAVTCLTDVRVVRLPTDTFSYVTTEQVCASTVHVGL